MFDKETGTLHKIGERDTMLTYFEQAVDAYRKHGFQETADDLMFMELPIDQKELDRVFQCTGYIKQLYEKTFPVTH